jgi:hypothetical protein
MRRAGAKEHCLFRGRASRRWQTDPMNVADGISTMRACPPFVAFETKGSGAVPLPGRARSELMRAACQPNHGGVNQQETAIGHSQWFRDHGDAWRVQLRLAPLASSDQNAQKRLNSTPIAERRLSGSVSPLRCRCVTRANTNLEPSGPRAQDRPETIRANDHLSSGSGTSRSTW